MLVNFVWFIFDNKGYLNRSAIFQEKLGCTPLDMVASIVKSIPPSAQEPSKSADQEPPGWVKGNSVPKLHSQTITANNNPPSSQSSSPFNPGTMGYIDFSDIFMFHFYIASAQLSNLWWMPNSVRPGSGPCMKTGSSRQFKWYPTNYRWVSSWLLFTVDYVRFIQVCVS